jgi:hypothetical protein
MVLNINTVSSSNISDEYIERSRILRTISGSKEVGEIRKKRYFRRELFMKFHITK